ncbi:DUF262 domain-containing protein [Pedobacter sp. SYP-B3415]|uniref:GmrSD restriction endonuclease domain-containing protein n=1 Tax=Pedobacter sp. SYP-B3415 TaxID=2496641 RepID=UPI00101D8888|nr:DUF262 domain-containing protein [Pedobacter sp. SYP-B3415]
MKTIKDIFNSVIFRIPDYQRGYSWEKPHLNDFWQDLSNLQNDKVHYTGMISVEAVEKSEYETWTEDIWLITGKKDTPYFIVDGQQRLTTIIILIWVIADRMAPGTQLSYTTKENLIDKYIFTENIMAGKKSYIFGYHKDNPSYDFLKKEIFEQRSPEDTEPLEETVYTNNLLNAKIFFLEKTKKMSQPELGVLLDKVTKQLKFDFKELEKELDIFIVFETMNNRGKPLSNLEKLKNRLIYISTLLPSESIERKLELRDQINYHWKIIYKYLGLNKERRLEDDLFLQTHWIMFKRYDRREPEFYANDIFDRYFTSKNIIEGKETFETIEAYIASLSVSATQWFVMNNPSHTHAMELAQSVSTRNWLRKINRLGYKSFAPLVMGALVIERNDDKISKLLQAVEAYIFLIFYVSFRRSNTGTYHFNAKASELYNNEISIDNIITDIRYWIYGNNDYTGYFDANSFLLQLKDLFARDNTNGYFDWKFLRYFLYEYDLSLRNKYPIKKSWGELSTVQHIYPNQPQMSCWKIPFRDFSQQQRKYLSGSLGNFVLVGKGHNEHNCLEEKQDFYSNYANAVDVSHKTDWTREDIIQRGLDMLHFMEWRWNVSLGSDDKKLKLLFIDFEITT